MYSIKILRVACFVAIPFILPGIASGQAFQNLNFEQSTITSSNPTEFGFNTGTANVPGWTAYNGWGSSNYSGGVSLVYNDQPLDDPGVSLEGTNYFTPAIQGKYSVLLQGSSATDSGNMLSASIGQTGLIPAGSESLRFYGAELGDLQVTFNGQQLYYLAIGSLPNATIYGADISAYAGQSGQLLFTVPWKNEALIDNIQFSVVPVPEPSTLRLLGICILFLIWRMRPRATPDSN